MSSLTTQVGGDHYKSLAIQPVEYITKNGLGYIEGSVIKYVTRHKAKHGAEDIKKAIHFLSLLLELEYGEDKQVEKLDECKATFVGIETSHKFRYARLFDHDGYDQVWSMVKVMEWGGCNPCSTCKAVMLLALAELTKSA